MRRFGLLIITVASAMVIAVPTSSAMDPAGICPDGFLPTPVANQRDVQKDNNNNGIVCRKVNENGQFTGGPDDTVDDLGV